MTCTCTSAGTFKWLNPECPEHGFNRPRPIDINSPKMPKEFEDQLRKAFKESRNEREK